jgi:hypothetical protein
MNNAELKRIAPAVFATAPATNVSDKYQFVPTIDIINELRKAGFEVTSAKQSKVHNEANVGVAKHVVRLRHKSMLEQATLDTVPEAVLVNSHNRSSAWALYCGLFRYICENGLIAADAMFAGARVLHNSPDIHTYVRQAATDILDTVPNVAKAIDAMNSIQLTNSQQMDFAYASAKLRWENEQPESVLVSMLAPRREKDVGNSLWLTMNRVQESLIKGGFNMNTRANHARTVNRLQELQKDIDVNRGLWQLAAETATVLA